MRAAHVLGEELQVERSSSEESVSQRSTPSCVMLQATHGSIQRLFRGIRRQDTSKRGTRPGKMAFRDLPHFPRDFLIVVEFTSESALGLPGPESSTFPSRTKRSHRESSGLAKEVQNEAKRGDSRVLREYKTNPPGPGSNGVGAITKRSHRLATILECVA